MKRRIREDDRGWPDELGGSVRIRTATSRPGRRFEDLNLGGMPTLKCASCFADNKGNQAEEHAGARQPVRRRVAVDCRLVAEVRAPQTALANRCVQTPITLNNHNTRCGHDYKIYSNCWPLLCDTSAIEFPGGHLTRHAQTPRHNRQMMFRCCKSYS